MTPEFRRLMRDVEQLRFDVDRMQFMGEDFFPAKVTNGQSGLHSWSEQTFNSDGTRRDLANGRFGTVTGLDGATVTRNPARMPDGSTLTTFPAYVWLRKALTTNSTLVNYEIFLNTSGSSFPIFGQAGPTTSLSTTLPELPSFTTIFSSLLSTGLSVSGAVANGIFQSGKYHFAWNALGSSAGPPGTQMGNVMSVTYSAITGAVTTYGVTGVYLSTPFAAPLISGVTSFFSIYGQGYIHNFVEATGTFHCSLFGSKGYSPGSIEQVHSMNVMFAKLA